jgi:non-heme chloroperoxidase
MSARRLVLAFVLLLASLTGRLFAQERAPWHDPSPHNVQFVTVDENVKLEVLDWGGSGRPLVLLAGQGNTAHVFDDFAPKLTAGYHVYGVTRRGYGASSAPASGYSADRLGDDVLSVLDTLKLDRPVLVGHSLAGEELSSIGSRHPERAAALIYLDAGYSYAYYDGSRGDLNIDLRELQRKLDELGAIPQDPKPLVDELLRMSLPKFERDLQDMQENLQAPRVPSPTPPSPTDADRTSYATWRSWQKRVYGYAIPEGEVRQTHEPTAGENIGKARTQPSVEHAVFVGQQKFADIRVPVLAIFALPHDLGPFADSDPIARADFEARDMATVGAQAKAFETGVPSARVVRLPHANHYVFLTNEADVLREMRAFVAGLH